VAQWKDFVSGPIWWCNKSKMADGRHLGFRCWAIISAPINIFAPNLVPRWIVGSPMGPSVQKSDFRKSKMADGRHLGFRFWAVISSSTNILHQIWYNDGKSQPKATYCSESGYRKSKITDGRHLEFQKVIIVQSWIEIFAWNFVWWLTATVESWQFVFY